MIPRKRSTASLNHISQPVEVSFVCLCYFATNKQSCHQPVVLNENSKRFYNFVWLKLLCFTLRLTSALFRRLLSSLPPMMQNSMLIGGFVLAVAVLVLVAFHENSAMMIISFHTESAPADHFGVLACSLAVIVLAGSLVVMNFQRPIDGSSRPEPPSSRPEPPSAAPDSPGPTHTRFFRTKKTGRTLHLHNCNYVADLGDNLKVEMRPCSTCLSLHGTDDETLVKSPTGEWHRLNCKSLLSGGRRRHIFVKEHITPCMQCKPLLGQRGAAKTGGSFE